MLKIAGYILCVTFVAASVAQGQSVEASASPAAYNIAANPEHAGNVERSAGAGAASAGYIIGPSDVLQITTWKEPELSESMPVRPDGKIALPLIGELQAAGNTADQLRDVIAAQLASYIENPVVTVTVHEIHSQSFNLLGKVVKPGSYALDKPTTVLDALASAGGFQDFAKLTRIYVLRRNASGAETMLPFNYKRVIKGEANATNIQLRAGDTVVVP